MAKSHHLSEEVYLAMISRGYRGEVQILEDQNLGRRDFLWLAFVIAVAVSLFWLNSL
jgi:cobalt/nickel transport system permease protein